MTLDSEEANRLTKVLINTVDDVVGATENLESVVGKVEKAVNRVETSVDNFNRSSTLLAWAMIALSIASIVVTILGIWKRF